MAFADKNYKQKSALYDILSQVYETYRWGAVSGGHSWNQPLQELHGVTMRYLGESYMELTYHRYEVTTVEGLQRLQQQDRGLDFLKEVVKEIKKDFKSETGKALTLEKVKENPFHLEKASRITAESSWMLGSSRYGHGARPVGKYLIRSSCIYDFSADL